MWIQILSLEQEYSVDGMPDENISLFFWARQECKNC